MGSKVPISIIHRKCTKWQVSIYGLSRANMEMKSNTGLVPLLKAYLHIIREGISFGKLSRVPTCNIQDAGKFLHARCYIFKIIIVFVSKSWLCMRLHFLSSILIKLTNIRVGFDTHTHSRTHSRTHTQIISFQS